MNDFPVRRLPPLKALRALEAIYLTGSVTNAALHLRVSHSAVSHQVKILEGWSATPLFSRQGRTTTLTEAGRSLAATAQRAFNEVRHEIDRLPLREIDPVSLAALPLIAIEVILPRLEELKAREPDIRLHLSLALADRTEATAPDLHIQFVRRSAVLASDIELFPGDAVPACAPALVERTGLAPAALLARGPHIHDEDLRMWPAWWERYDPEREDGLADGETGILLEGSMLIHSAVLGGLGVGFARRAVVSGKIAAGRLLVCADEVIDSDWVYVVRPSSERAGDPKVRRVAEWLCEICGAE